MKKQAKDILKSMSESELMAHVEGLRRDLFSARLQKATKPLKDTTAMRKMRKEIAAGLTYLQQKRIAA